MFEESLRQAESQLREVLELSEDMLHSVSGLLAGSDAPAGAEDRVASQAQAALTRLAAAHAILVSQAPSLKNYSPFERSTLESQAKAQAVDMSVQKIEAALLSYSQREAQLPPAISEEEEEPGDRPPSKRAKQE